MKTIVIAFALAFASIAPAFAYTYSQCTTNCYGDTCTTNCY